MTALLEVKDLRKHYPVRRGLFSRVSGYVYAVDRANTGMHIVELTGSARAAADFSKAAK